MLVDIVVQKGLLVDARMGRSVSDVDDAAFDEKECDFHLEKNERDFVKSRACFSLAKKAS